MELEIHSEVNIKALKDSGFKKRLVNYCIESQQQSLKTIQAAMEDAEQEAAAYGCPKDRYDGFRNQQIRKRNMLSKQLEQTEINLRILRNIDFSRTPSTVSHGTLTITDQSCFFVAVGIGLIHFEEDEVAVFSTQVPVYLAIKDKKSGESFEINGKQYTIKQLI
jgi:hypothetical protein